MAIKYINVQLSVIALIFICLITFNSCDKESFISDPDAALTISADTIMFDTIFSATGSMTRNFKIYNQHKSNLLISKISLAGSLDSPYRINLNGISDFLFENITLKGGDSLYLFVEVTVDPLNSDSPLIVKDSIVFSTNGNIQDVKLITWGQDINILDGTISSNTTLFPGKPYLVYNHLFVDTNCVLFVEPGVKIHFNKGASLFVAGTLVAEGETESPVTFEGSRTESLYRNIPGQWGGIYLMPGSKNNRIVNSVIKNGTIGIQVDTLGGTDSPTLYLNNSIIDNMTYAGILARGSTIYAGNSIISNSGHFSIVLIMGGDYTFFHTTVANYWIFSSRRNPSLYISNYYTDINGIKQVRPMRVVFGNSIIHGSYTDELATSILPGDIMETIFINSLLKTEMITHPEIQFDDCLFGVSPLFVDSSIRNFRLDINSPAVNSGDYDIGNLFPFDLDGKLRPFGNMPDMGAYEFHEEDN